jgi:hypothetical protein
MKEYRYTFASKEFLVEEKEEEEEVVMHVQKLLINPFDCSD